MPNEGQNALLDKLSRFIISPIERKAFILLGYAGTGKTSMMAALVQAYKELRQKVVLLAPTGRASKRMSESTLMPASTIHRFLKYFRAMRIRQRTPYISSSIVRKSWARKYLV